MMQINRLNLRLKLQDFKSVMFVGQNKIALDLVNRLQQAQSVLGLQYDYAFNIGSLVCNLHEFYSGEMILQLKVALNQQPLILDPNKRVTMSETLKHPNIFRRWCSLVITFLNDQSLGFPLQISEQKAFHTFRAFSIKCMNKETLSSTTIATIDLKLSISWHCPSRGLAKLSMVFGMIVSIFQK